MKTLIISTFVILCLIACKAKSSQPEPYKNIDVTQAKALLSSDDKVTFIDVRTPGETDQGIISGALKINVNDDSFEQNLQTLDKNKEYVIYCKSGGRSVKACKIMSKLGFTNLANLKGGYTAWEQDQ